MADLFALRTQCSRFLNFQLPEPLLPNGIAEQKSSVDLDTLLQVLPRQTK